MGLYVLTFALCYYLAPTKNHTAVFWELLHSPNFNLMIGAGVALPAILMLAWRRVEQLQQ